jgi:hypothetical protein
MDAIIEKSKVEFFRMAKLSGVHVRLRADKVGLM